MNTRAKTIVKRIALFLLGAIATAVIAIEIQGFFQTLKPKAHVMYAKEIVTVDVGGFLGKDRVLARRLENHIQQEVTCRPLNWAGPEATFTRDCVEAILTAVRNTEMDEGLSQRSAVQCGPSETTPQCRMVRLYKEVQRLGDDGAYSQHIGVEVAVQVFNEGESRGTISKAAKLKRDNLIISLSSPFESPLGARAAGQNVPVTFSNLDIGLDKWRELMRGAAERKVYLVLTVSGKEVNTDEGKL
jgi:hypothetical protein